MECSIFNHVRIVQHFITGETRLHVLEKMFTNKSYITETAINKEEVNEFKSSQITQGFSTFDK